MRRRFIADTFSPVASHPTHAAITGEQADHLTRVLRAQTGQVYDIVANGFLHRAEIVAVSDSQVDFILHEELQADAALPVHLLLAVFKFDHFEWAIEKATELGVARITPILARRTEKHLALAAAKRAERWRRIALESSKQSRRTDIPDIVDPMPTRSGAYTDAAPVRILLSETEQSLTLASALNAQALLTQQLHHDGWDVNSQPARLRIDLAIGPEGGWTLAGNGPLHPAQLDPRHPRPTHPARRNRSHRRHRHHRCAPHLHSMRPPLKRHLLTAFLCALAIASVAAQTGAPANPLAGVIDIHAHTAPDSTPRSIDAIDLARLAQSKGMRAIVYKNHFEPTADMAYLVHKVVPGIEAYGGIDLNLSVGGMNPAAVEKMALTTGHLGRFVWMSTYDSHAAILASGQDRPYVAISRNGKLLPDAIAVLAMIKKYNLIMATGHNSAEEDLLLIRESRALGITQMVVTHAMLAPISMTIPQMQQAAAMGAYIEFVYNGLIGGSKAFDFADYARAIRAVGIEHCILSSDMGQPANPLHTDGLVAFFTGLEGQGFTQAEIARMSKSNPAKLLGLP